MITLDYIIEYLKNPMKTGVYNFQVTLDFSKTGELYEYLFDHIKARQEKSRIRREIKKIRKAESYFTFRDVLKIFSEAVYTMLDMEKCPKVIEELYESQVEEEFSFEKRVPDLVSPTILSDLNDVISIEVLKPNEEQIKDLVFEFHELDEVALDITSVKKEGCFFFLNCLKATPKIGKAMEVTKEPTETHSSRYTYRPYAIAVRLWLEKEASKRIPKDLRAFINNSAKYHISEEWRTSIVLSAITVESLLADLFEEKNHEPSPSKDTLGQLFETVRKQVDFPKNIADAITMTNEARISAVHRSRFPVSDREATNALYGTTNFTMWYFSEFQTKND